MPPCEPFAEFYLRLVFASADYVSGIWCPAKVSFSYSFKSSAPSGAVRALSGKSLPVTAPSLVAGHLGSLGAVCDSFEGQNCDNYSESWLARVWDNGLLHPIDGAVVTLCDIH